MNIHSQTKNLFRLMAYLVAAFVLLLSSAPGASAHGPHIDVDVGDPGMDHVAAPVHSVSSTPWFGLLIDGHILIADASKLTVDDWQPGPARYVERDQGNYVLEICCGTAEVRRTNFNQVKNLVGSKNDFSINNVGLNKLNRITLVKEPRNGYRIITVL